MRVSGGVGVCVGIVWLMELLCPCCLVAADESRPAEAFTTERAVRNGRANAASGRIMVNVPNDHFGPILPEHDPVNGKVGNPLSCILCSRHHRPDSTQAAAPAHCHSESSFHIHTRDVYNTSCTLHLHSHPQLCSGFCFNMHLR